MQGNSLSAIREVAADTQRYPDKLLVAVMQGQDASLPQDIAMAALQTRRELQTADRKSTRLNSSHSQQSRMPSSA